MMRFLCAKKNASGSSGSSGSCTRTRTSLFFCEPVGHVEAERREVALVVAEQLVVQPDVGEVVDRGEAQPGPLRVPFRRVDARVGELPAVPHGSEEVRELLVEPEVVGHHDLAPVGLVGAPLPATAELDDDAPARPAAAATSPSRSTQSIGVAAATGAKSDVSATGAGPGRSRVARIGSFTSTGPAPSTARTTNAWPSWPVCSWYAVDRLRPRSRRRGCAARARRRSRRSRRR